MSRYMIQDPACSLLINYLESKCSLTMMGKDVRIVQTECKGVCLEQFLCFYFLEGHCAFSAGQIAKDSSSNVSKHWKQNIHTSISNNIMDDVLSCKSLFKYPPIVPNQLTQKLRNIYKAFQQLQCH